ncbi:MAG: DUF1552 domain-containing protein [Gemmatimonadetes bacterium]|nr:DUF1552 domain-containing protein [Gemmatimonadota bacterium]MDA1103530.1 DUF1552 domain-containing protein [Gemmatimonadota bacterium]
MHFITGKHLERRTFIRGMGASLALPFLDAMVPAGRLSAAKAAEVDPTRLVAIEMVHGAAGSNEWGATQNLWAPAAVGRDFDLSPSALLPLDPWRKYLTIVSNTDVRMAEAFQAPEIGGDHFRSSAVFLTQQHPKQTEGSDVYVGTSLDQLYAQRFGQDTPVPSMQLCIENINQSGGCAYGYTCVYTDSISWASPTEPLPVIRDPRVAFEQLFGAGGTADERALRRRTSASILDWVSGRVAELQRELGPNDRDRLDRYLQNVRELERRIQMVEAQNASGEERELPSAPAGVPDSFEEHVRLMFDLQALAFASDTTRVFSFKMGRDSSARVFPESGTDKPFHPASHHGGREEAVLDFYLLNKYHVSMLPYFLEKLDSLQEGDATLLDKTLIMYGSPMADGNLHNHRRAPLFLAGGANGHLEGNLHLKAPDGTPMANVMLSVMHKLGLDDVESFGDSTGDFPLTMPNTSATPAG